ncbi:MAG: DUF2141 domain-containing protein [Bacteroidota bacterium]
MNIRRRISTTPVRSLLVILCTCTGFLLAGFRGYQQHTFEVEIQNIKKNGGDIIVEVFTDEANWLKNAYAAKTIPSDREVKTVSFDLPYGKYAVSIFQDTKENGELDRTFIGIPKEPIAFGNNYKPFGSPKFKSALIDFNSEYQPQALKLFKVF